MSPQLASRRAIPPGWHVTGGPGPVHERKPRTRSLRVVPAGEKPERAPRGVEKSIAILLIEDNRLVRMGLAALLKQQEDLKLVAAASEPEPILQGGLGQRPDVILLDIGLGERGSAQIIRGIRSKYPEARLIMMGLIPMESEILSLVKEGVSGFVLKDASISEFVASIRAVAAGQKVLPTLLTESLMSQIVDDASRKGTVHLADVRMTMREREIVGLIAEGLSNKEIGKRLSIATDTVKSHVHNILEKLSLRSRVEVAVRARERAHTLR